MPPALWLMDVLSDEFRGSKGFRVDYYPGWEKRSAKTTFFAPEGVMEHHTGPGSYNALLSYMAENSSISPLCNTATSRPFNGVVRITVVAAGRANHAGAGELPWRKGQGSTGNPRTLGRENQNDGRQSWPAQQVEAIRRCGAAELTHLKQSTARLVDHKTYAPSRKVDRHSVNLNTERQAVSKLMSAPPTPTPDPVEALMTANLIHLDKRGGTAYVPDATTRTLWPLSASWQAEALAGKDWNKNSVVVPKADVAKAGWRIAT